MGGDSAATRAIDRLGGGAGKDVFTHQRMVGGGKQHGLGRGAIGAGQGGDANTLAALGLFTDLRPRFVKHYAELGQDINRAVEQYCRDVRDGAFPDAEHSFR